uniref:Fibrous sheath-interacting protein 1 n=1 Tax=Denticeps clupeoides TaxID=299321 RepID=A0AAY4BHQ6_9TELE
MLLFLTLENRLVATSGIRAASLDTTRWRSPSDCCQQSVHFTDRRTSSTILTGFSLFSTSHVGREHAMLVQQGACPPITPRRGEMEITKGALEGISRPASGERFRAGSRVSRASVPEGGRADSSPTSLEVLSCDVAEELVGKNEDPQLQKAINKMKSLDKTLAIKISYEKEVRKQGRELHQKLWQELLVRKTHFTDEAENTRLFLALTPNSCKCDVRFYAWCFFKVNFISSPNYNSPFLVPESVTNEEVGGTIFSTQIPDKEYLKHINKESGEGYSPEPLQLDQLVQIDARLHTLLPVEDFLSVRSPYPDHISPQVNVVLCIKLTI